MALDETTLPVTTQTTPLPQPSLEEDANEKYRILHRHVLDYQAGKPGAAEAILNSFEEFLYKYYNFIVYGGSYLQDTSIRRFISLFTDVKQAKVSQYRYSPFTRDKLIEKGRVVRKLLASHDPADIMQYLRLALLEMAVRYNDHTSPNGSFHTYVHRNFHFYAARAFPLRDSIYHSVLSAQIEDVATLSTLQMKYDEMIEEYNRSETQVDHELLIQKAKEFVINEEGVSVYDDEVLNLNWVNGVTCTERFKELTPFERKILILSYLHDLQDDQIADEYGFCRATINRKKMAAVKKLLDVI